MTDTMCVQSKSSPDNFERKAITYLHLLKVAAYVSWEKCTNPKPQRLNQIEPEVDIEAPRAFYADFNLESIRGLKY